MKKILSCVVAVALCLSAVSAQVLGKSGINNTLSTTVYQPLDNVSNGNRLGAQFSGFQEQAQVRVDISKFTMDGKLKWTLATDRDPVYLGFVDDWYLNFVINPFNGFDIGMGTNLNWTVGATPSTQGGLVYAYPDKPNADNLYNHYLGEDAVGSLYYANDYAAHAGTQGALGLRYRYSNFIEVGVALPSSRLNSDSIVLNLALKIKPIDLFDISVVYDGLFQHSGNLYIGSSFYFSKAQLDAYIAANFRPESNNTSNNLWGFGAAVKFGIPNTGITFRPEVAFTFYSNPNYTFAWNTGLRFDLPFAKQFNLGTWVSFGWGAKDRRWTDHESSQNYTGGFIFNIHPDFTWNINSRHSLKLDVNYENRKAYFGMVRDTWSGTLAWGYKY